MRRLSLLLCPLTLIATLGCTGRVDDNPMPAQFTPPGIALPDIDVADASYDNKPVVIQGVVSPSGQGGWPGQNDGYEVHCFTFAAWHRDGEPALKRDLTILRPVPPDADYWNDFPKLSIQRVRALLSSDESRAIFVDTLPVVAPAEELEAIATVLQKPVVFSHHLFGNLVLDRTIGWFEAEAKWNGESIRVTFPADDEKPGKDAITTAEALWSNQAKWKERVEEYAVEELLELKNDTWLEDGESQYTPEEFVATMTLTSISIGSDGAFEFWYDDGDLFWGHSIMVSGNLKDGPTDAGIHG